MAAPPVLHYIPIMEYVNWKEATAQTLSLEPDSQSIDPLCHYLVEWRGSKSTNPPNRVQGSP